MSKLVIETNQTFKTDVEVRESDEHSKTIFVSIKRNHQTHDEAAFEMFLSATQLEQLGRYFTRQAEDIRNIQAHRKFYK
jgi:hypothetical protein